MTGEGNIESMLSVEMGLKELASLKVCLKPHDHLSLVYWNSGRSFFGSFLGLSFRNYVYMLLSSLSSRFEGKESWIILVVIFWSHFLEIIASYELFMINLLKVEEAIVLALAQQRRMNSARSSLGLSSRILSYFGLQFFQSTAKIIVHSRTQLDMLLCHLMWYVYVDE